MFFGVSARRVATMKYFSCQGVAGARKLVIESKLDVEVPYFLLQPPIGANRQLVRETFGNFYA